MPAFLARSEAALFHIPHFSLRINKGPGDVRLPIVLPFVFLSEILVDRLTCRSVGALGQLFSCIFFLDMFFNLYSLCGVTRISSFPNSDTLPLIKSIKVLNLTPFSPPPPFHLFILRP